MPTERIENLVSKYIAEEFNYSIWNGLVLHRKTGYVQCLTGTTILMNERISLEHVDTGTYRLKSNGLFIEGKIDDMYVSNYYPEANKEALNCFVTIYRVDNDNLEIKVLDEENGSPVDKRLFALVHFLIYA